MPLFGCNHLVDGHLDYFQYLQPVLLWPSSHTSLHKDICRWNSCKCNCWVKECGRGGRVCAFKTLIYIARFRGVYFLLEDEDFSCSPIFPSIQSQLRIFANYICLNAHILVTNSTEHSWKWLKATINEYLDYYFSFPTRCCKGASSWGYTCLKMLGVPLFFLWRWEYVTLKNGLTLEMHLKMK